MPENTIMGKETPQPRKIMVVAEPTRDSAAALQYALAHAVVEQDELILLHLEYASSWKNSFTGLLKLPTLSSAPWYTYTEGDNRGRTPYMEEVDNRAKGLGLQSIFSLNVMRSFSEGVLGESDYLDQMKRLCEVAQPKIRLRMEKVEIETSKAAAIILKTDLLGIDTVIVGQHRSFSSTLLGATRGGGSSKMVDTADYLIENSKCNCIAVQKKGQNKGYLLNSKTHKNFWLLA